MGLESPREWGNLEDISQPIVNNGEREGISPANTDEKIEMPFGLWSCGPTEPCIR